MTNKKKEGEAGGRCTRRDVVSGKQCMYRAAHGGCCRNKGASLAASARGVHPFFEEPTPVAGPSILNAQDALDVKNAREAALRGWTERCDGPCAEDDPCPKHAGRSLAIPDLEWDAPNMDTQNPDGSMRRGCDDCGAPGPLRQDPHATNLSFCEVCYAVENPPEVKS